MLHCRNQTRFTIFFTWKSPDLNAAFRAEELKLALIRPRRQDCCPYLFFVLILIIPVTLSFNCDGRKRLPPSNERRWASPSSFDSYIINTFSFVRLLSQVCSHSSLNRKPIFLTVSNPSNTIQFVSFLRVRVFPCRSVYNRYYTLLASLELLDNRKMLGE